MHAKFTILRKINYLVV